MAAAAVSAVNNGKPWVRTTPVILAIGITLGALPGGVAGLMWHNWQLQSLENRFNVAVTRFDALKLAFEREVERERDEDDRLERGIADAKQALARLEGSLPLKLPAISEFIEQDKHLNVQDGRLDGMDRRLAAMCGQLAAISAASAKKAGC